MTRALDTSAFGSNIIFGTVPRTLSYHCCPSMRSVLVKQNIPKIKLSFESDCSWIQTVCQCMLLCTHKLALCLDIPWLWFSSSAFYAISFQLLVFLQWSERHSAIIINGISWPWIVDKSSIKPSGRRRYKIVSSISAIVMLSPQIKESAGKAYMEFSSITARWTRLCQFRCRSILVTLHATFQNENTVGPHS